jgi:hypothetical protein
VADLRFVTKSNAYIHESLPIVTDCGELGDNRKAGPQARSKIGNEERW